MRAHTKREAAVHQRLRKIISAWPETDERISHGAPTWWGGRKTFATLHHDHHGDGRLGVWINATHEQQADLVESDPDTFYVPPYVGVSGWVTMRLDLKKGKTDWDLAESLLEEGYRRVAPKRAIKKLDGG
jgi:hypothetical protein